MAIISLDEPENRDKDDLPTYKEKCEQYVHWLQLQIDHYTRLINKKNDRYWESYYIGLRSELTLAQNTFKEIFGE